MNTKQQNTIYLVRHGENPANVRHEFSYKRVDYSLTPKGVLQAKQTAEFFKDKNIDEIYSSPLKRAKETAEAIAQPLGLPIHIVEQFRELNVGDLENRPPTQENWDVHNRIVQDWFEGKHDTRFPDGEDYHQLIARYRQGLLEVTTGKTGKNIVIAGHGGIFTRTLLDLCPEADASVIIRRENYNCAITTIELTTTNNHVEGVLQAYASYDHLSGEAARFVDGTSLIGREPVSKQI